MGVTVVDLYLLVKTESYTYELIREDKTRDIILQISLQITASKELILLLVLFKRKIIISASSKVTH